MRKSRDEIASKTFEFHSAISPPRARVRGGFLYKLGVVSYTIRILVYPACILHVS